MSKIEIRQQAVADGEKIYRLIEQAFKTADTSDGTEQDFYMSLKNSEHFIEELDLVAEAHNVLIGQIMFTRFTISNKLEGDVPSLLLAPISVVNEYRGKGVGAALIKEGLARALRLGFKSTFLIGNPAYYSRFGFKPLSVYPIKASDDTPKEYLDYIQGIELVPDALMSCSGTISFAE
ncbi:GNAT family N-acetyltransferase [Bartonella sp. LJL80]